GLNIVLPHEQSPNTYITPELCFNFHYFAIRKMHFLMRARALAVFPGGFGTLDELFETLTLIQTGRMERIPIVLFGEEFWKSIVNFDARPAAGHNNIVTPTLSHRPFSDDPGKLPSFVVIARQSS
ncbi:MAG: LOG family protein, partial [Pseudomonadota bacterium]